MKNYPLIDILKFVSALSIISIHTQPMLGHQDSLWFTPYLWLQCFAIPFFFVSSSFLFFYKTKSMSENTIGGGYCARWLKRTFTLYGIYSLLNIAVDRGEFFSLSWQEKAGFFLLGKSNGYLWFFAALILSVMFIHCIDVIYRNHRILRRSLHGMSFLLVSFLMVVLQFCYAPISHTSLSWIAEGYYLHFENVRNFLSGIFFCYMGYVGVSFQPHYFKAFNRLAIGTFAILSLLSVWYCNTHNIWREGYTTLGISALLFFVIIECANVSGLQNKVLAYMRKSSNIIYFQHRYAIILLAIASKVLCPIQPVAMFFLTVAIMCATSYIFLKLEATSWRRYTKYLY